MSDSVSLIFYAGCAIELFLEQKTTAAMALGLQMCFTMRNSLELQVSPPRRAKRVARWIRLVLFLSFLVVALQMDNVQLKSASEASRKMDC